MRPATRATAAEQQDAAVEAGARHGASPLILVFDRPTAVQMLLKPHIHQAAGLRA
jgi:hypothetical protein